MVAVLLEAMTSWVNRHTRLNGIVAYLATLLLNRRVGIVMVKELFLHVAPDENVVPKVDNSPRAA